MSRRRIILLAVSGAIIAYLLYVAVFSFISIQGAADMTGEARGTAIMSYVFVPLIGVALVSGLGGAVWFWLGDIGNGRNRNANPPAPPRPLPIQTQRDTPTLIETPATTIRLTEPSIDLWIVLTGDAARDPVGRRKIGAVMEHYGSGNSGETVIEKTIADVKPDVKPVVNGGET